MLLVEPLDLRPEMFFAFGFVVYDCDGVAPLLQMLDQCILIVVHVILFLHCSVEPVIVSARIGRREVPGDIALPAGLKADLQINDEAGVKDAPV